MADHPDDEYPEYEDERESELDELAEALDPEGKNPRGKETLREPVHGVDDMTEAGQIKLLQDRIRELRAAVVALVDAYDALAKMRLRSVEWEQSKQVMVRALNDEIERARALLESRKP